jgi:hypothetical protein
MIPAAGLNCFTAPAGALSDGSMSTVGDIGYVDSDGFVYLTDRTLS